MSARFQKAIGAFAAGGVFGAGLLVSGMAQPEKVLGFLDVFGSWDPSLMLVMMGAIAVHGLAYRATRRWQTSLTGEALSIPRRRPLSAKLFLGSALFGLGWGLGGYCPGPSVVSLATAAPSVLLFVACSVLGTWLASKLERGSATAEGTTVDAETGGFAR